MNTEGSFDCQKVSDIETVYNVDKISNQTGYNVKHIRKEQHNERDALEAGGYNRDIYAGHDQHVHIDENGMELVQPDDIDDEIIYNEGVTILPDYEQTLSTQPQRYKQQNEQRENDDHGNDNGIIFTTQLPRVIGPSQSREPKTTTRRPDNKLREVSSTEKPPEQIRPTNPRCLTGFKYNPSSRRCEGNN